MSKPLLVVIESPFAPGIEFNKRYLRECMIDSLRRGEAPFASHLLYASCLNDAKPGERRIGIEAGLAWAQAGHVTAMYFDLGVSGGMAEGYAHAVKHQRRIEWRSLPAFAYLRKSSEHVQTLPWVIQPPKT